MGEVEPTRIMIAVNESTIKRPQNPRPHLSISCNEALNWTFNKIIGSNAAHFRIYLIAVHPLPGTSGTWKERIASSSEQAVEDQMKRLEELLSQVQRVCINLGVATEILPILTGDPKEVICCEAGRIRPDFVVVGSRGLNAIQQVASPSVSEYVKENAGCPVVAVPRKPEETPRRPIDD